MDHAGHCEVVVPGTGPDTETMSSGGGPTRPGPTEQPITPARAGPPDNFETPPPEALRLNKLEDFQAKQKIIEEQNRWIGEKIMINKFCFACCTLHISNIKSFARRRKQMLAEALMSRKQQTAQESAIFFTLAPNFFYCFSISGFSVLLLFFCVRSNPDCSCCLQDYRFGFTESCMELAET